jgi:hypothetical protein
VQAAVSLNTELTEVSMLLRSALLLCCCRVNGHQHQWLTKSAFVAVTNTM